MLDYDEKLGGYRVDITDEQLKNALKIEQGKAGGERTGTATRRSMCAAATLLLGGSAVIAESVFRFRSIRRSLGLASVTLAGRRVGAV
jgi:hypothetical protein